MNNCILKSLFENILSRRVGANLDFPVRYSLLLENNCLPWKHAFVHIESMLLFIVRACFCLHWNIVLGQWCLHTMGCARIYQASPFGIFLTNFCNHRCIVVTQWRGWHFAITGPNWGPSAHQNNTVPILFKVGPSIDGPNKFRIEALMTNNVVRCLSRWQWNKLVHAVGLGRL